MIIEYHRATLDYLWRHLLLYQAPTPALPQNRTPRPP